MKPDWVMLQARLAEWRVSPEQILADLDALQSMATNGYSQDKATAKGEVVVVHEVDLPLAHQILKTKAGLMKDIIMFAEKQAPSYEQLTLEVLLEDA